MDEIKEDSFWIFCPVCGGKTRTKVCKETVLVKFPLYCPKCKKEVCTTENCCQRVSQTENAEPAIPITIGTAGSLHFEVQFHTFLYNCGRTRMMKYMPL